MKQLNSIIAFLLLSVLTVTLWAQSASVETELDRTELARGETVTMRVRVYGQQGGVAIDLEPLRSRFEIVSTRSASHLRSVNNRIESWTDYMLVLFPRELGEQEIPSISVAGQQTRAYTITVSEPDVTGLAAGQDVYMEAILSKDNVYVQEQLLFTIRLYYTIAGIRNPNFTEVEPENAVVQLLGAPHQYEQLIDGQRYGVYEKNYVIFPQRSGELVIPDIVFRGELTDGSSNFVFRNPNMRPVTAFATGYTINVRERPLSYPEGTWLPASDLQIRETWSTDITQLRPGDSVERTLTVTANGLDGAALPPLGRPQIDRMSVYPDPPNIERLVFDGNVVGTRTEKYTLVATEEGSVVIPEVTVPWWDITTDTLRYATVPASFIRVASINAQSSPGNQGAADGIAMDSTSPFSQFPDELLSSRQTPAWVLNIMALTIAVVLFFMWWLWRRRPSNALAQKQTIVRTPVYEREIDDGQEKLAFSDLENSIDKADPQRVRLHLIAWGRQYFRDAGLHNLDDLSARMQDEQFKSLFHKLQACLYSNETGATQFTSQDRQGLSSALKTFRSSRLKQDARQREALNYELPPLYRH
jgi:hypothetical protein